jgi:hypothetical protein
MEVSVRNIICERAYSCDTHTNTHAHMGGKREISLFWQPAAPSAVKAAHLHHRDKLVVLERARLVAVEDVKDDVHH